MITCRLEIIIDTKNQGIISDLFSPDASEKNRETLQTALNEGLSN